jgi:hypothetical protein
LSPTPRPEARYDKSLLKRRVEDLCVGYLGPAEDRGARLAWRCPFCCEPGRFVLDREEKRAGCLADGCPAAGFRDALGVIALLERLDPRDDFVEILRRGYLRLGLESDPGNEERSSARDVSKRPPTPQNYPKVRAKRPEDRSRKGSTERGARSSRDTDGGDAPKARRARRVDPAGPGVQPGHNGSERESAGEDRRRAESGERREPSGAARVRDRVYRRLLQLCPPKEGHVAALGRRGVMEETVRVGRLGSLDTDRSRGVAARLEEEFGAKRLLIVPGFERGVSGRVRLALSGEHVLLPCFDARGLLSGVESLPVDRGSGGIEAEETVLLPGADPHLYLFAHYRPEELEGFCEGALGALLAAQDDVLVGAIGHFRRYAVSPGKGEGTPRATVLPQLEGVDFAGRGIPYVPRTVAGEGRSRAREAPAAARWLVEKRGGVPRLVALDAPNSEEIGATSLGEWLLALDPLESEERLRRIFSLSPARREPTTEPEPREKAPLERVAAPTVRRNEPPDPFSAELVTPRELAEATLAGTLAFAAAALLLWGLRRTLHLAENLGLLSAPAAVSDPPPYAAALIAVGLALFALQRRVSIRRQRARMLEGRVRH